MPYVNTLQYKDIIEHVQNSIPVDVDELAKLLKIGIVSREDVEGNGYIEIEGDTCTIYINSKEDERQQRFTIAHEIAHFLLHGDYLQEKKVMDRGKRSGYEDNRETEANKLAAEILMPLSKINEAIESGKDTVEAIQNEFNVSDRTLKIRLNITND